MRIQSLEYSEWEGTPQEWAIEGLSLGPRNLIVGKNASGKSRALNIIASLAGHISGLLPPTLSGSYDGQFLHEEVHYRYQVSVRDDHVVTERLSIGGTVRLDRNEKGEGVIYAEQIDGGRDIPFQTPPTAFAVFVRRDQIQHKYLEPLYSWASSLRHYQFGTHLGKDSLAVFVPQAAKPNERDPNAVVAIFRQAEREFKGVFTAAIIKDLEHVGYNVTEIGVGPPITFRILSAPGEVLSLFVKEKDLPGITDQHSMSQGMFRTLALLIHLNYSQLKKAGTCVLIDDIGEGLDFDRSCRLIDLLREKATETDIQIILATNDRFVMNHVPLEEWSVLQRKANHVSVRNYGNSKDIFEEFKFTGLSNFSFLEMDVINQAANATKH